MAAAQTQSTPDVACIDIGSNTVKLLVARRCPENSIHVVDEETLPVRLGAGISRDEYRIPADSMDAAAQAVHSLAQRARRHRPERIAVTATSAAREAANRHEFRERVSDRSGLTVRILSGDEEARYVARGVACDPALPSPDRFLLLDIGGGSMELVRVVERIPAVRVSVPLGAIRLTERWIPDPSQPIDRAVLHAIARDVAETLASEAVASSTAPEPVVGTGGAVTWARILLARNRGRPGGASGPLLRIEELRELLDSLASLPQSEREARYQLPRQRADILPAALAVLIAALERAGAEAVHHSFFNLRFGVCAELLDHPAEIRR